MIIPIENYNGYFCKKEIAFGSLVGDNTRARNSLLLDSRSQFGVGVAGFQKWNPAFAFNGKFF